MFTERQFIRERMKQIHEERRALADEYWTLAARLRELDSQDRAAIVDIDSLVGQLSLAVQALSAAVPNLPPVDVVVNNFIQNVQHKEERVIVSHADVVEQQEKDAVIPARINLDLKSLVPEVVSLLKEQETPIKSGELRTLVESKVETEFSNFSHVMNVLMQYDSRIERPYRGFYQYRR